MRNKKKRKDEKGKTKQAEVEKTLYQHISNRSYIPHISYIYFPYQRNKKFHIKTSLFEQFFFSITFQIAYQVFAFVEKMRIYAFI